MGENREEEEGEESPFPQGELWICKCKRLTAPHWRDEDERTTIDGAGLCVRERWGKGC